MSWSSYIKIIDNKQSFAIGVGLQKFISEAVKYVCLPYMLSCLVDWHLVDLILSLWKMRLWSSGRPLGMMGTLDSHGMTSRPTRSESHINAIRIVVFMTETLCFWVACPSIRLLVRTYLRTCVRTCVLSSQELLEHFFKLSTNSSWTQGGNY